MCGILGKSRGDLDLIEKVNSLQSHRGPDDHGVFIDKKAQVGLGHTRLSVIDTSPLGHQPMLSKDGRLAIVFNGEIYNFRELRDILKENGFNFYGKSDTEVLLNLYLLDGVEMLSRLNGIFAFAIWDYEYQSLFIARDGLGVKPLYYSESTENFAFASEIKALLHLFPIDKKLDEDAINRYLAFLWCPGEGTPLTSVKKLLPGEAIIVKNGKIIKKWTWYRLPIFTEVSNNLKKNKSISGTLNHLRQAVHRQMISDVPLGAFLSGGLDSSSIVALAREINPDIKCFTIDTGSGQDEGVINDLPYAKKVAKHLKVDLEIVSVDHSNIVQDLQFMVTQLDEPLADPAALNVFYISQLAKKQGIKVLLSGSGGDDLFTGYRRHYAVYLQKYLNLIPMVVRESLEKKTKKLSASNSIQRRLSKFFNGSSLDGIDKLTNYFRWADDALLQSLYSKEFKNNLSDNISAEEPMVNYIKPIITNSEPLDQILAMEQRFFLADHNLNYTDKMSMAAGIEVRVPFLDMDLVNFSAQIPNKYKQKGRIGKWVLKKAMESYLPHDVIYRTKTGFGVPLRRWIKFELKELLTDLLSTESINKRGIFSSPAVHQLILDNDNGKIDASYTLLSLLCIEIWCRAYIDH
jgi:asparagine synthase (glutamine-hydrolysing)